MPKRSWNLNTVYISERLQECLRPISRCALTTVVAPMGYGKTTAVNWYLLERAKLDEAAVARISVYSDNLAIFWKSVQEAFSHAGFDFLRAYPCPDDAAGGSLLTDDLCHALAGKQPCYIFIDDFHLLTDNRVPAFLCTLTNRLPENVHLIVASRDRFLPAEEILRLGGRLYTVGAEQLRLNHTELSIYAHRCGTELSDAQIESLLYSSEGWFSAIYLNLRTLHERGELPSRGGRQFTIIDMASGTKRMGNICMRSNSTVLPKTTTRRCASSSATRASCSRRLARSRCSTSSPTARSKRSRSTRFRSSF